MRKSLLYKQVSFLLILKSINMKSKLIAYLFYVTIFAGITTLFLAPTDLEEFGWAVFTGYCFWLGLLAPMLIVEE